MDTNPKASFFSMSDEQFNRMVAVLIALVTVLVAVVTYLQNDAAQRDDQANRDSKRYSVEAFGRQVSGNARVNFDESVAYQMLYDARLAAETATDEGVSRRYNALADKIGKVSPLLTAPYYDPQGTTPPDVAGYEAAVYLVKTTELEEKYQAAWEVKNAWDYKANTYILYLTLLAVVLFMLGLAATLAKNKARWVFIAMGLVIALVAISGALNLLVKPVVDLRQQGNAISDYSQGVGLAYQDKYEEAIAAFDQALAAHPAYTNALVERAGAQMNLGNYAEAAKDYAAAIQLGERRAFVAGNLAWAYYLLGDFPNAIAMNRQALQASPDELWIQFDLGLSLLAAGQVDQARAEYARGMDLASQWVKDTVAAGQEPPSFLWWSLDDAAASLDDLTSLLAQGAGSPPPASIQNAAAITPVIQELLTSLKSLSVGLEYSNQPPAGTVSARIGSPQFSAPVYDDAGEIVGYSDPATSFAPGIKQALVSFTYDGMQNGQEYLVKLYVDGEEDPSWRVLGTWDAGASGSMEIPLSYDYSDSFTFDPGEYTMELYVDQHLVQRGSFTVAAQ